MLLRRLAVGGMAEVYVAKTKGIGGFEKLVAIKVIHPGLSEDEHFVQMLVEEAKITVQLNHVNIAQTFDLGCIDDTYYIAMEYIEGADAYRIEKCAREQELAIPLDIAVHIVAEVSSGLGYAHRKRGADNKPLGIVHRDVSPQNVLISYFGEVKLVDFGIAKAALRGGQTEAGVIKGKYYYMSPEQAWGDPVDGRTDVFSAGLLLHELLTGEMVYQGKNVPMLLERVRRAKVPSPRHERPDVPEELAQIVMKALAKEPRDRFQSADAMAQALTQFLNARYPTFTASRLAQLMGTLFPEEAKRHNQLSKLPTAEQEAARWRPSARSPSTGEGLLPSMSREEFGPGAAHSVIFDLDDIRDQTRDDILPFRKKGVAATGKRQTRRLSALEDPDESTPTRRLLESPEDWDEETVRRDDEGWADSTLVERGEDPELSGVPEPSGPPAPRHRALARAHSVEAPTPPDAAATARAASDAAVRAPSRSTAKSTARSTAGSTSGGAVSAPPLATLPARPARSTRPASLASPAAPSEPGSTRPPPDGRGSEASRHAQRTLRPRAAPSKPGLRAHSKGGPFDPIAVRRSGASQPEMRRPLSASDPFLARTPPTGWTSGPEQLGKPSLKRFLWPMVIGLILLAPLVGLGGWLAAKAEPSRLEVMTVPDGAQVTVDGRTLSGTTPVVLEDVALGQSLSLEIRHPGYESISEELRLDEGLNRKVYLLNPIRMTLRIETQPPGAQVWVDGVLRGSAPLDIAGLSPGQTLSLRSTSPGRQAITRSITLVESERAPRVTLELPEATP